MLLKPSFVDPWERFSCIYLLMYDDVLNNNNSGGGGVTVSMLVITHIHEQIWIWLSHSCGGSKYDFTDFFFA